MLKETEKELKGIMRVADIGIIVFSSIWAHKFRNLSIFSEMVNPFLNQYFSYPIERDISVGNYSLMLWIATPIWLIMLNYFKTYEIERTISYLKIVALQMNVCLGATIALSSIVYFLRFSEYKRSLLILLILFVFCGLTLFRVAIKFVQNFLRKKGMNYNKALIVGTGESVLKIVSRLESHKYWGFQIIGYVGIEGEPENIFGLKKIGVMKDLQSILRYEIIDDLFIAHDESQKIHLKEVLKMAEMIGVSVHLVPDKYDLNIAKPQIRSLGDMPLISYDAVPTHIYPLMIKRILDISLSIMLLPILGIVCIIVYLLNKINSKGKTIYVSRRLTQNKREFKFYKLRTMVEGADQLLEKLTDENEMTGPIKKIKNDPRVTTIGRWLRKYSIDELPQIINVLKGEMSFVGPRPPTPEEVNQYSFDQLRKLSMLQGITGLWQVSGRDEIKTFEDRLKLDLEYIDNWSLWLDLKIICKTVFVVFKGAM